MAKSGLLSPICVLAATALACSGSGDDDTGVRADSGTVNTTPDAGMTTPDAGSSDGGDVTPDAGPPPEDAGCTIEENVDLTPTRACNAPGSWTVTVAGRVNNPDGTPADGAKVNVCLEDTMSGPTCLRPRPVCDTGRYEVLVPEQFRCAHHLVSRAFVTTGGHAYSYCDIANGPVEIDVPTPVALVATEVPSDLPPEGDRMSARTVTFSDGLELEVTPAEFFANYDEISAVRVPQADVCTLAGGPAYEGIYAFYPEVNLPDAGFPLRIPNTTGLPANSTVRLSVLGGLACSVPRPGMDDYLVRESEWYEYGTATVSSDGTMIEGDNLPCYGWLAYRP